MVVRASRWEALREGCVNDRSSLEGEAAAAAVKRWERTAAQLKDEELKCQGRRPGRREATGRRAESFNRRPRSSQA